MIIYSKKILFHFKALSLTNRFCLSSLSTQFFSTQSTKETKLKLFDQEYLVDDWTNINKSIQDKLNRNLLHTKYHPLHHLANKIKYFFYKNYTNRNGTPLFSVYDNFKPVVSVEQNFDRLVLRNLIEY